MSEGMTQYGLSKTYDGGVHPRHVFYIRNGADIGDIDWSRMEATAGLAWSVWPLISQQRKKEHGNRQEYGE